MKTYEQGSLEVKEAIANAVFAILKEKPIEAIKVGEVSEKAYVGRTTFYRYYGMKSGLEEALYFALRRGWEKLGIEEKSPDCDEPFFLYLYTIRDRILLLQKNHLENLVDRLVLSVYGPKEDDENYYFRYIGAGMWIGAVHAMMAHDFQDSPKQIRFQMMLSFAKMAQENQNKKAS